MTLSFTYQMRVLAIPILILGYFFVAGVPALFHFGTGEEKYLFYHFFVFTEVPAREQISYEAVVTSIEGRHIAPIQLQDADVLASDELRNRPEYSRQIEQLGVELAGGSVTASQTRAGLEAYVRTKPITYEIREVRYNPIERFLMDKHIAERTIATFTVE